MQDLNEKIEIIKETDEEIKLILLIRDVENSQN
jgi:hypothetical protein